MYIIVKICPNGQMLFFCNSNFAKGIAYFTLNYHDAVHYNDYGLAIEVLNKNFNSASNVGVIELCHGLWEK